MLSVLLEPSNGLFARERRIVRQPERLEIALAENESEADAAVSGQGQNGLAVLRAETIGHAAHRARL